MNQGQFIYWLQGFFEISETTTLNEKQVQIVKDHLNLILKKITPDRSKESPLTTLPHVPLTTFPFPGIIPNPGNPLNPFEITCTDASTIAKTNTGITGYCVSLNPIMNLKNKLDDQRN